MLKNTADVPRRGRFIWLLSLLLVASVIRYAFQIDIPRVVFTVIIVLIALLGDRNEIMAIIMCCIPLHESVDLFYSLVFCALIYVFKFQSTIRINTGVLVCLLMIVWELVHCINNSFTPLKFLVSVIPLIVLAIFMCMDASTVDYPLIVRSLSCTTLCVAITLFVNLLYRYDFNILAVVAGLQRLGVVMEENDAGPTLVGGVINPNSMGVICVLASTGLLQMRKMKVGTKADVILVCLIIICGALTASRTYLVCLFAMVVLLVITNGETVRQRFRFAGMLVFLMLLAVAILSIIFPNMLEYYIGRFLEADITTGRLGLMQRYHEFIIENPKVLCFGIGLQDFGTRLVEVYRVASHSPHNSIQEIVIAWGIPGILLFVAMIFCMYYTSNRFAPRKKLLHYIPMLIILLKSMVGQLVTSPYTMLALSYAYLSLCCDMTRTEQSEEIILE